VDELTRRFQRRVALIGDRAALLTGGHWKQLPGYDEADIPTFARTAGPTLAGAKAAAVATGVGYYATRAKIRPPSVNPRKVKIDVFHREPFIAYWNALSSGVPRDTAVESGIARAGAMARNLAISASRLAAPLALARRPPEFWIRVPDGGACDWCLEVADAEYRTADAADIGHDRCGCSIDPAY
jgi:hypothetical protein